MSTTLIEGYGTKFGYCTTVGGTYTFLGELIDFTPAEKVASKIKTSHMLSPSKTHTYRAGMREPGEAKAVIHLDKVEYAALDALIGTIYYWETYFSDGSIETQQGFLMSKGPKVEMDGIDTVELTICMTGPNTFTGAS